MISIYQLFPRIFGNTNNNNKKWGSISENGCGKFDDINNYAINSIKDLGFTHIWLTGILMHSTTTDYTKHNIPNNNPLVVKGVAGSPYAIKNYYDVDPDLANKVNNRINEFENLVDRIHKNGLKAIIDFVPNHLAREYYNSINYKNTTHNTKYDFGNNDNTSLEFEVDNSFYYYKGQDLKLPHQIFDLQNIKELKDKNQLVVYHECPAKATGNNCFNNTPNFNDWYDTIKLNYGIDFRNGEKHFSLDDNTYIPKTWHSMYNVLRYWAYKGVDGFRCDMVEMVPVEFWHWVIKKIKREFPKIIFIAEIYNFDLYEDYINIGHFDYLYDKINLYDTLRDIIEGKKNSSEITKVWQKLDKVSIRSKNINGNSSIHNSSIHNSTNNNEFFNSEKDINCNDKMLRFIENHDEQRIASKHFAKNPLMGIPAFAICALMHRGGVMLYNGQELGITGDYESGYSKDDGRTTIFDYWSENEFIRWNNNGIYNLDNFNNDIINLRNSYSKILNLATKNKTFSEGYFYDLMWQNKHLIDQNCFAFLRGGKEKDDELCLVVVNFSNSPQQLIVNLHLEAANFFNKPNIVKQGDTRSLLVEVDYFNWTYINLF
ncbi:MAG: alpha-amylase family glycosyl hydrolase [Bacteroidales bacterium]|jgi:glycosidase